MRSSRWVQVAALLGFLGVGLGAFAAHILKNSLDPYLFEIFQVGVKYHLIHTLALLGLGLWSTSSGHSLKWPGSLFLGGIVLFSGSLYLMAVTGFKALGMVTPIGGFLFLAGWLWIFWKFRPQAS